MRTSLKLSLLVPAFFFLAAPSHPKIACTLDVKLCPDGVTYVGRDGENNCEWQKCPDADQSLCGPYLCVDGTFDGNRCAVNPIAPCLQHGGVAAKQQCSDEMKVCSDGVTYVGRDENNNCAWEKCPGEDAPSCAPYVCADGTKHPSCSEDGHVINYFAPPCLTHGGDAGAFTDVPTDHPNAAAITYVRGEGIVEGYADSTYKPDATINRAEFVKILVGAVADENGPMCKIAPFPDVDQGQWYATYAHKARCLGLVQGYPDGSFQPAHSINFVEAAKILSNAYGLLASTTIPACETSDCPWYRDYVLALEARAAIPTSVTRFDQSITRGEMAEMIYRLKTGNVDELSTTYDAIVTLSAPAETSRIVLHFYTPDDVANVTYEARMGVVREIPKTPAVADAALKLLFAGPNEKEYSAGARTTDDLRALALSYRGVTLHASYADPYGGDLLEGVAIVDFDDAAFEILNSSAGRQFMVKAAIEATLKEFPTIHHVLYAKNGEVWVMWDA